MTETLDRLTAALADRYRIERELGRGGMATVYLAEDLKHKRKVALKVLKPELAAVLGADRFVQEITTTAALQHPHILPLFDSGESDGFLWYAMPFIDGETLRGKLDRETQLGIDESVRIATDVASALHYAHTHGVIHRDIKPENILLHDGRPMVADFGIALALSAAAGGRMTETGMSLGTPHYMSPEQATAEKEITARSDIYSLGSVCYEMLAGQPPHLGGSAQQIIMKIVTEEATPVTQHRKSVPLNVAAAVAKSLEKLPADRFESAKAFAEALGNPAFRSGRMVAGGEVGGAGRSRTRRALGAVAWCALGAGAVWLGLHFWSAPAGSKDASRQQITYTGRAGSPAISPDGRFVAFIEQRCPEPPATGGCVNLEVLEIGTTTPVEVLTGADHLNTPRWTHDGLSVVIGGALSVGRAGLFVVPRLGGTPRQIADEPLAYDTHPTADSVVLVFARDQGTTLRVIPIAAAQTATPGDTLSLSVSNVAWSPDGQMFAIAAPGEITVISRTFAVLGQARIGGRNVIRWSPDGRSLLTFRWSAGSDDDLVAFPVRADGSLGPQRLVASQLRTLFAGNFDVARATGRMVLGGGSATYDIWSFDLAGPDVRARRLTQGSNWYGPPVLNAAGDLLYFLRADALGNNLYTISDGRELALTAERQVVNFTGRFALDGRVFAFESMVDSGPTLAVYDIASGTLRRMPRSGLEEGWVIGRDKDIALFNLKTHTTRITDSAGGERRTIAAVPMSRSSYGSDRMLAPDGRSLAVLGDSASGVVLYRLPLDGGAITTLAVFPQTARELALSALESVVGIGLAAWSADGIYLARGGPGPNQTTLLHLDPRTGMVRQVALLPARCAPRMVSVSADGKRAACIVPDSRGDLALLEGIQP